MQHLLTLITLDSQLNIVPLNLFKLLKVTSQKMQTLKHQKCMNTSGHWKLSRSDWEHS